MAIGDHDRTRSRGAESDHQLDAEQDDVERAQLDHMRLLGMRKRQIQRKAARQAGGGAQIPESGGTALAGDLRARMEPQLGADLSNVKIHTGGDSATAAEKLGARAFTTGSDVHFGAGEFAPGTKEGDRLIAHELTHAVQAQKSGIQRKASQHEHGDDKHGDHDVSQPDEPAEQEADAVADGAADNLHGGGKKVSREPGKEAAPAIGAKLSGRRIFRTKKDDKKDEKDGHEKKDDKHPAAAWKTGDPLPNASAAVIDMAKFTSYSMDPGNKGNQGKAVAFKQIGYPVDDEKGRQTAATEVVSQLRGALAKTPATSGKASDYGQRFEVRVPITGPKGAGTLVTAWQVDKGGEVPRLITNWLEVHK
ncbi:MAG: eCIS core domain-containing protein [Thermoanaerobaculia bacterium]